MRSWAFERSLAGVAWRRSVTVKRMIGLVTAVAGLALGFASSAQAVRFSKAVYAIPPHSPQTSVIPESVVTADFNHDGKLDIAVLDALPQSQVVDVYMNKGGGHFSGHPKQVPTGCPPGSIARDLLAGEFNGDKNPDLFLICNVDGVVIPGNGKGGFGSSHTYTNVSASNPVTVGSFDGRPDLEYIGAGGYAFCYLPISQLVPGGRPPICSQAATSKFFTWTIAAGTFGSGAKAQPIAAVFANPGAQTIHFFGPPQSGSPCCPESDRAVGVPNEAQTISFGDLNRDHNSDVLMGNYGTALGHGSISVYLWDPKNGTLPSANPTTYKSSVSVYSMVLGDFNHDGRLDVAAAGYNSANAGKLAIQLGNGKGALRAPTTLPLPGFTHPDFIGGRTLAVGDFNGDGKPDLVAITTRTITVLLTKR